MTHDLLAFPRACRRMAGLAAALMALATSAAAADDGDAVAGHRLARTWCGGCHVVDQQQRDGPASGAPTFMAVSRMTTLTQPSLRAFLRAPHGPMPDFHLSSDEIADVAAYILSLRPE